jgi:ribulose 1,5-bisphosphate synthetase/thiazole synthase
VFKVIAKRLFHYGQILKERIHMSEQTVLITGGGPSALILANELLKRALSAA